MRTVLHSLASRGGPVLRWEDGAGASLELTGPVLANWVHKARGLLGDLDAGGELDLGLVVSAGEPLHWRALAGALAAFSLGATVRIVDGSAPTDAWIALVPEDRGEDSVTASADEVLVFPVAPLALGVDAPPDTIDFATALRTFPDQSHPSATPQVRVGDAEVTETADLAALLAGPRAAGLAEETDPAAEVFLTSAPRSAEDWARVFAGLLRGLLVLRPAA